MTDRIFGNGKAKASKADTERFMRILAILWSDGNWFRFPRCFLAFLTMHEAVVLSYLLGHMAKTKALQRAGGWFWCKIGRITKELHISTDSQKRTLKKLVEKKLVRTKRKGIPAKRWFFVDVEELWEQVGTVLEAEDDDNDDE